MLELTLDEAIKHCKENVQKETQNGNLQCAIEHNQLAIWLSQLEESKAKAAAYDRLMSGGKKTIQEVANFFGVPMEWTGREVMFRIGEYTLTKSMENFIENPDTNYVVRFEPEKEATDD